MRSERRGARSLDTGVHVGFVVVADVDHVVAALHRPRQRLQTDVVGSPITTDGDEVHLFALDRQIAKFLQRPESGLGAADGRRDVLECGVDVRDLPRGVRIDGRDDFHAASGRTDDRILARGQHDLAQDVRTRATGAGAVPTGEEVFVANQLLQIDGHDEPPFIEPDTQQIEFRQFLTSSDLLQLIDHFGHLLQIVVAAAEPVDPVVDRRLLLAVERRPDLGEDRTAEAAERRRAIEYGDGLAARQHVHDFRDGKRPEETELEQADLHTLIAVLVDHVLGSSSARPEHDHHQFGVVEPVFLEEIV